MKRQKLYWAVMVIAVCLLVFFLYTLLHEGGHALTGLLLGAKITDFNLDFITLGAHVGLDGDFSAAQHALISLAGVGLPLIVLALYLGFSPQKLNPVAELFRLFVSVGTLFSLLAWVVLPVLTMAGVTARDDAVNFLGRTGMHPLALSAAALLIFTAGVFGYFKRAGGPRAIWGLLHTGYTQMDMPEARRTMGIILGSLAAAVAAALAAGAFANSGSFYSAGTGIPEGYELLAEADLGEPMESRVVGSFVLEETVSVNLYVSIRNFKADVLEVVVEGPDGFRSSIVRGEGYSGEQDRIETGWEEMPPGEYRVIVTGRNASGILQVFIQKGLSQK